MGANTHYDNLREKEYDGPVPPEGMNLSAATCERQEHPWEFAERMAKEKQRQILSCSQEVIELERIADWLRSMQHKMPEDIKQGFVRMIARYAR